MQRLGGAPWFNPIIPPTSPIERRYDSKHWRDLIALWALVLLVGAILIPVIRESL